MNEKAQRLVETLYGHLPAAPAQVETKLLHRHVPAANAAPDAHPLVCAGVVTQRFAVTWRTRLDAHTVEGATRRIPATQKGHFSLEVLQISEVFEPRVVIICGDACWHNISDEARIAFLQENIALAWFNRTETAPDRPVSPADSQRDAPIFAAHPDADFGAISAWAWAYHRAADTVREAFPNAALVFSGHSRGGKAALLAGATDARAWLTHANNAGMLGTSALHNLGEGAETWTDLARAYPHWVSASLRARALKPAAQKQPILTEDLPNFGFEQDDLLAEIAPRGLLITQALEDLWANPRGTADIAQRLRGHFANCNASEQFAYVTRAGGHAITDRDWLALKNHILAALQR